MTRTRKSLAALLAAPVIAVGGVAACNSGGGSGAGEGAPPPAAPAPAEPGEDTRQNEPDKRDDVRAVTLDDRSAYGMADYWITYKITNNSSKTSDYMVQFDVTDPATGERVASAPVFENGVKPGQTVSSEAPALGATMQPGQTYKVEISSVERTEAF